MTDSFNFSNLPWTANPLPPGPPKKRRKKKAPVRQPAASKPGKPAPPEKPQGPVIVTLRSEHIINGVRYGPGRGITLPFELAQALLNAEGRAIEGEEAFRGTKAAIIGGRTPQGAHRIIEIPGEVFADAMNVVAPADRVSGKGMSDPGVGGAF